MIRDHHEMWKICPFCGYRTNAASPVGDHDQPPADGNLSLCIDCGEFSVFEAGGLRKPTDAEYLDFGAEPEIQQIRRAWVEMDRQRRREKAG